MHACSRYHRNEPVRNYQKKVSSIFKSAQFHPENSKYRTVDTELHT